MSSYFSSCCTLLNLLMNFLRWVWVCQLPGGTDGLPLEKSWPLQSFSFTSLGGKGRIYNAEYVLNVCLLHTCVSHLWQFVSTACVCATWVAPENRHHRYSKCSCICADWGKKSTWKKCFSFKCSFFKVHICLLFWRSLFTACQYEWLLFSW